MPAPTDLPLRDIHLPESVGWWPPAPGWWALALLALVVALTAWGWRRYHARRRVLVALQQQLDTIVQHYGDGQDAHATIEQLSILLRRAVISFFPRRDVASLTGEHWLEFLNTHTDGGFDTAAAALLTEAVYRPVDAIAGEQVDELIVRVRQQLPVLFRRGTLKP